MRRSALAFGARVKLKGMPERRPDPRDPSASLVDSGWAEAEQPERVLPRYEDAPREHLITRVDDQIQSRLDEMRESVASERAPGSLDVTKVGGAPNQRSRPEQSSPRASSLPPPPPARPRPPMTLPPPSRPPPPPLSSPTSLPPIPVPPRASTMPPPAPALPPPTPASFAAVPSLSAPALPPVQPLRSSVSPFSAGPSLGEALTQRVRIGAGDLPLWGVLVPMFVATAVVSAALVYLLFGARAAKPATIPEPEIGSARSGAESAPVPKAESATVLEPRPGTPLEKAASGDAAALAAFERKKPEDLRTDEALAIAAGRAALSAANGRKLRERLASDPVLIKDPKVVAELLRASQVPETARDALAAMAAVPGPISADLLYEVWTGTVERSGNTELARSLLLGRDVRAKASPALLVAIALRESETCEANEKLLARATEVGDRRAFGPLSRLLRRTGCGPGKKQDCYPCLRTSEALKTSLEAVKLRREPDFLRQ